MQLGGNANAGAFFRSHHCDTTDTQLKYKSRAAQLYRDKLHGEAAKAMRIHGPKLFIDAPQSSAQEDESAEAKDDQDDFFEQSIEASTSVQQSLPQSVKLAVSFISTLLIQAQCLKITGNVSFCNIEWKKSRNFLAFK